MERMMEIFAHYGKNGRNVIFSYFRVQRAYVILSSEKLASAFEKLKINKAAIEREQ